MDLARDPITGLVEAIRRDRSWLPPAVFGAACVHAACALGFARFAVTPMARAINVPTQVIDIDLPKPSPPPPEEPPPSEETNKPALAAKIAAPAPAPPPPAQAAAVLTRQPEPDDPVDLTGDGFVVGTATNYAGGVTASNGTNRNASLGNAGRATSGIRIGPSRANSGSSPDRSRAASIMGGSAWNCPFPTEADTDGVDNALVNIRVEVTSAGTARNVVVLSDPGHGFAREARRCAMSKVWNPTLDRDGNPVQGTVTLRVRFDR